MRAIVCLFIAGILTSVTFAGQAAYADPLARPKSLAAAEHLDQGNKLFNLRSFALAADQYKAGALLDPVPVFDYNLGQTYRMLGQYEDAIWHYERFLKSGRPRGKMLAAVNNFIEQMKAELTRKAMTEQPDEPAPMSGPRASDPTPTNAPSVSIVQPSSRESWYDDGIAWGLASAGLLAVGSAAWLLVSAADLERQAARPGTEASRTEELRDRAGTRRVFGVVTAAGGGLLLVTGVVKLVLRPKHGGPTASSWNIDLVGKQIALHGRF